MPWINRFLDLLTIEATRGFFGRISATVYQSTGYRCHPATFQMIGALVIVGAGYWVYVAIRGAKA